MSLHDALARHFPSFSAAAIREAAELLVANDVLSFNDVRRAPDCQSWPGSQARERVRAAQTYSSLAKAASDVYEAVARPAAVRPSGGASAARSPRGRAELQTTAHRAERPQPLVLGRQQRRQ